MRHPASAPLIFTVGLAATFVGDMVARLDPSLHHAGWQHGIHTILLAVPAGILVALLLREGERVVAAAALAGAGWIAALLIVTLA